MVVAEPEQSGPPRKISSNPVIGHLKTRDKFLTIRTGPDGPLYTVKSKDGRTLAVDLPGADLSAKFPELKDVVEGGIADWAGMDLQYHKSQGPVRTYETKTIIIERNNDLQLTE